MTFLNRTRIFTVYLKPGSPRVAESAEFVEDSFSWPALIFGWLWAAYHRIWWLVAAQVGVIVILSVALSQSFITAEMQSVIQLAIQALIALEASNLRHGALLKRGYVVSDIVAEDSLLHAQQRYYSRHASIIGAA
jgi:hypothetical protein